MKITYSAYIDPLRCNGVTYVSPKELPLEVAAKKMITLLCWEYPRATRFKMYIDDKCLQVEYRKSAWVLPDGTEVLASPILRSIIERSKKNAKMSVL